VTLLALINGLRKLLAKKKPPLSAAEASAAAAAEDEAKKAPTPMQDTRALFRFLLPSFTLWGEEGKDCWLIMALGGLGLVRTWILANAVELQREIIFATHMRDQAAFRSLVVRNIGWGLARSVQAHVGLFASHNLGLRWRAKLTTRIHRNYFSAMSYYSISHMGDQLSDPDNRITTDIKSMSDGFAAVLQEANVGLSSALYFMYQVSTK
jgi:hypothetical protein